MTTASKRAGIGGPKSAEGKLVVSQNAVTHGIHSPDPVAGGESEADWDAFYQGFCETFRPVGVPEEETVREMAMTKWRLRRVIKAETADMNARFDAIDDPTSYPGPSEEDSLPYFGPNRSVVERGVEVLEALRSPDGDFDLIDPDWDAALALIELTMGLDDEDDEDDEELPEEGFTKDSFLDYLTRAARSHKSMAEQWIAETLEEVPDYIDAMERHAAAQAEKVALAELERQRLRRYLERAALLPSPEMEARLWRAEAHLDRRFAKLLSQLELLQRMRTGQDVPPPVRLEIHDDSRERP